MANWSSFNAQYKPDATPTTQTKVAPAPVKNTVSQPTQTGWGAFNAKYKPEAISQEARSQPQIDAGVYTQARTRGASQSDVIKNVPIPQKISFAKEFVSVAKDTAGGLLDQMMKDVRASSQFLATPVAGILASNPTTGLNPEGVKPSAAMKESLKMAKDMLLDPKVSVDDGVDRAAQMYLQSRGVGKYGGKEPNIADVGALTALGIFNLFGDPAFEAGRPIQGLKELATYKKVGEAVSSLPEGASFVKGTTREFTIPLSQDLKIKVVPSDTSVTIKGYKKRFPSAVGEAPDVLPKEAQDLIMSTRDMSGHEITAKFQGNDLVIKPQLDKPISTPQPTTGIQIGDTIPQATAPLQSPVSVEGKTLTSKLSKGVEQKAIEAKLTDSLGSLPEYQQANMAEQATFAVNLLKSEPQRAVDIAMGREVPPSHILPESVFTAVENQALQNGDVETLRQLANSNLTTEATAMGQRIRALGERNPFSPVSAMQEIKKARETAIKTKTGKSVQQVTGEIAAEIKAETTKTRPKFKDWQSFIDSIEC